LSSILGKELRFLSGGFENRSFALLEDPSHAKSAFGFLVIGGFPGQEAFDQSRFVEPIKEDAQQMPVKGIIPKLILGEVPRGILAVDGVAEAGGAAWRTFRIFRSRRMLGVAPRGVASPGQAT
jgi:hypothetical protein